MTLVKNEAADVLAWAWTQTRYHCQACEPQIKQNRAGQSGLRIGEMGADSCKSPTSVERLLESAY